MSVLSGIPNIYERICFDFPRGDYVVVMDAKRMSVHDAFYFISIK